MPLLSRGALSQVDEVEGLARGHKYGDQAGAPGGGEQTSQQHSTKGKRMHPAAENALDPSQQQ